MHMSLHLYSHVCAHDSRQPSQNVCVMRMCSICQMLQSFTEGIVRKAGPKRIFFSIFRMLAWSSQLNMVWFSVFCWLNRRKTVQGGGAILQLRVKQIRVWSSISERSDRAITSSLHRSLQFLLERWKEGHSLAFPAFTIHLLCCFFIWTSHFSL